MAQQQTPEAITSDKTVEILIRTVNGKRRALYRTQGQSSKFWWAMPVRQAEKALREGFVHIGMFLSPAVSVKAEAQ